MHPHGTIIHPELFSYPVHRQTDRQTARKTVPLATSRRDENHAPKGWTCPFHVLKIGRSYRFGRAGNC